jgi:hypothetical protein
MQNQQNKSPPNSKILERLKKLFALGQSSNQHEAELAIQKASELTAGPVSPSMRGRKN